MISDTIVELTAEGDPVEDEILHRRAREHGTTISQAWLEQETERIHNQIADQLIETLNTLHDRCRIRIREAICSGATPLKVGRTNRNTAILADEITDLRYELAVRDRIATAIAMYDDTRQQAITGALRLFPVQMQRARDRATSIANRITASEILAPESVRLTEQ